MKSHFYVIFKEELAQREFDPRETMQWLTRDTVVTMSWGFHSPKNWENKGLLFKVNGALHKGFVCITLGWNDTYTVTLLNNQYNLTQEPITDIYCDELQYRVDILVETKETP